MTAKIYDSAQDALTVMQEASPCLLILHPESLLSKNVDGVFARTSILHGKSSQSLNVSRPIAVKAKSAKSSIDF